MPEQKEVAKEESCRIWRRAGVAAATLTLAFPSASPEAEPPYDLVVSVGDSIAAGFGNPPYREGTAGPENHCSRSKSSTPASTLGKEVINIACQGANLDDIIKGHMYNETESQFDKLRRLKELGREPEVIVFSGGINERSLADLFEGCLGQTFCDINPDIVSGVRSTFVSRKFQDKLQNAYSQIINIFPNSKVAVLGYVSPIGRDFPWALIPAAGGVVLNMNDAIDDINKTQKQAVKELGDDRIIYIDPPPIGSVHGQLFTGVKFEFNTSKWTFGHPNKLGQHLLGQRVEDILRDISPTPSPPLPLWFPGQLAVLPERIKSRVT